MADEKPTVTDKASPLSMEKVKHSSLEYAVQHDGPAYRQKAVAPYKESALPGFPTATPRSPTRGRAPPTPSPTRR